MPVKVFVLGPPGSGKSTACRTIQDYILQSGTIRHIARLSDHDILQELFFAEQQAANHSPGRFRATMHEGFDVIDLAVFDETLRMANEKINIWSASEPEQGILVEFSRDNYTHAFAQFEPPLLKDAYFLYIDAQEELRRTRLRKRIKHPRTPDDHFVSDYILDTYYARAATTLNVVDLCEAHGIEAHRIKVLTNNGSLEDFRVEVRRSVDAILQLI